jgi:hypothetical protein
MHSPLRHINQHRIDIVPHIVLFFFFFFYVVIVISFFFTLVIRTTVNLRTAPATPPALVGSWLFAGGR